MKSIPFFYFPTTVHLVDDHPRFPSSIVRYLTQSSRARVYTQSDHFLESMVKMMLEERSFLPYLEALKEHLVRWSPHAFSKVLHGYLQTSARFDESAVVTIDYSMPQLNGLEVSKRLPLSLKKILLTGEADHSIALSAFNAGIIDQFIRKDIDSLPSEVSNAILALSLDYFADLTTTLIADSQVKPFIPDYLLHPEFRRIFLDIWHEHQGVEFYLVNPEGDFICLTAEGKAFQLSFRDEAGLMRLQEQMNQIHLDEPSDVSENMLAEIVNRRSLPVFPFDEDLTSILTEKWHCYLHEMKKTLFNRMPVYYAYAPLFDNKFKGIASLEGYQQN